MEYTAKQIENAKRNYNAMLKMQTLADYDVENIGRNTAEQRMDYHNRIVSEILAGNKELEKEWKLFFLKEAVKADQKAEEYQNMLDEYEYDEPKNIKLPSISKEKPKLPKEITSQVITMPEIKINR